MKSVSLDFNSIEFNHLITHFVGNPSAETDLILSKQLTEIAEETDAFLMKYFVLPLKQEELFCFRAQNDGVENDMKRWCDEIFNEPGKIIEVSEKIAQKLYECSGHVGIKEGLLNVAHFHQLEVNNKTVDAIGLFKTETDEVFLKMLQDDDRFVVGHDYGYLLNALDKGCLILNYGEEDGYTILNLDKAKGNQTQFWMDNFLGLKPIQNEYKHTQDWISLTDSFVKESLVEETVPTERMDIMNRAKDYFKEAETFKQEEFESAVLQEEPVIQSFRTYNNDYKLAHEVELEEEFDISNQAVKKQNKVFKSVLKLDKNFHVYVHGNRDLIERGEEQDGRKYYKLYYENEE